jgi:maltose O-acetyltransferase
MVSSPIVIKDFAWIATGAIILPGVTVGKGAVVGAGAVVRQSIPDYATAIGNPCSIHPNKRVECLQYDPVIFCAPYEAWIGRNRLLKSEHM